MLELLELFRRHFGSRSIIDVGSSSRLYVGSSSRLDISSRRDEKEARSQMSQRLIFWILRGIHASGYYGLPRDCDWIDVLKSVCSEAGWHVRYDGTPFRQTIFDHCDYHRSEADQLPPQDFHQENENDLLFSGMDIEAKNKLHSFSWRIEKFSEKYFHISEIFFAGGYPWQIEIFPNGIDATNYLAIILLPVRVNRLKNKGTKNLKKPHSLLCPYGWSRYAQFRISIVDQINIEYTFWKESEHQFNVFENKCKFRRFMNIEQLRDQNRDFLVNDTCLVKFDLMIPEIIDCRLLVTADCSDPKIDRFTRGRERRPRSFSMNGWKFSFKIVDTLGLDMYAEKIGLSLPFGGSDFEVCIRHLDSDTKFIFSGADAFRKYLSEKCPDHEFSYKDLSTYASPLEPSDGLDSAYAGKTIFKNPKLWEDVEWESLGQQVFWADKHRHIVGSSFPDFRMPKLTKYDKKQKYRRKDVQHALVHVLNYFNYDGVDQGRTLGRFKLVVTTCGWFFSLLQLLSTNLGARRTREMTMHCRFQDNIVHREIIERESKIFKERLFSNAPWKERLLKRLDRGDVEMVVRFHEIKWLNIQGAHTGGLTSNVVYHPLSVRELDNIGEVELLDNKIQLLFANSGELIKSIEAETETRIQIIPMYYHPHPPFEAPRRKAYISGSKEGVDDAACRFTKLLTQL